MKLSPWFPYNQMRSSSQFRLFCFPHSGGVASIFRSWQSCFPSSYEICPIQLPGRENRFAEPLLHSVSDVIQSLYPAIQPFLDIPFALFGHSLGAILAFELIKKIRKEGASHSSATLFVSACSAPHHLSDKSQLHKMPDAEFLRELEGYKAMPRQLLESPEAIKVLLPRLKADFTIFETYRNIENPDLVDVPLVAFGSEEDELVPLDHLKAWEKHSLNFIKVELLSGGHFYYLQKLPDLAQRIVAISGCLNSSFTKG